MKLSTRTRYGARAMLDLALDYGKGPISSKEIAERQNLSQKYLENLMTTLRSAGLIRSVRGPQGGHVLASPPEEITLRAIFEALEGASGFVECTTNPDLCERHADCLTQEVWAHMYEAAMAVLEKTTLADLVRRSGERRSNAFAMYYI